MGGEGIDSGSIGVYLQHGSPIAPPMSLLFQLQSVRIPPHPPAPLSPIIGLI